MKRHPDLTVPDLPKRPGVLTLDPRRLLAVLREPRVIQHPRVRGHHWRDPLHHRLQQTLPLPRTIRPRTAAGSDSSHRHRAARPTVQAICAHPPPTTHGRTPPRSIAARDDSSPHPQPAPRTLPSALSPPAQTPPPVGHALSLQPPFAPSRIE